MDKVVNLKLVADYTPAPDPPEASAEFSLNASEYSVTEGDPLQFTVVRSVRQDQTLDVDWAFLNVSVSPISGTIRFNPGEISKVQQVTAQSVDTNELGSLELSNPQYVSGPVSTPILASPSTAAVNLYEIATWPAYGAHTQAAVNVSGIDTTLSDPLFSTWTVKKDLVWLQGLYPSTNRVTTNFNGINALKAQNPNIKFVEHSHMTSASSVEGGEKQLHWEVITDNNAQLVWQGVDFFSTSLTYDSDGHEIMNPAFEQTDPSGSFANYAIALWAKHEQKGGSGGPVDYRGVLDGVFIDSTDYKDGFPLLYRDDWDAVPPDTPTRAYTDYLKPKSSGSTDKTYYRNGIKYAGQQYRTQFGSDKIVASNGGRDYNAVDDATINNEWAGFFDVRLTEHIELILGIEKKTDVNELEVVYSTNKTADNLLDALRAMLISLEMVDLTASNRLGKGVAVLDLVFEWSGVDPTSVSDIPQAYYELARFGCGIAALHDNIICGLSLERGILPFPYMDEYVYDPGNPVGGTPSYGSIDNTDPLLPFTMRSFDYGNFMWQEFENVLWVCNFNTPTGLSDWPQAVQDTVVLPDPGIGYSWYYADSNYTNPNRTVGGIACENQSPLVNTGEPAGSSIQMPRFHARMLVRKQELQYPLLATTRIGSLNYTQSGTLAETDRKAIGLMDCVFLGGFFGTFQDQTDPGANYISRVQVTQEILNSHNTNIGNDDVWVWTYDNQMETGLTGTEADYINTLVGPNGDDGWFYDENDQKVETWPGSYGINLTDYVADKDGINFCEWHTDTFTIPLLIDPHLAAGIGVGKGGINGYWDNLGVKYRRSGVDPDNNGLNNDMQEYFDPEDATHTTGNETNGEPKLKAVEAMQQYRTNQRSGLERAQAYAPGFGVGGNTNQWEIEIPNYIIKEYRVDPDDQDSDTFVQVGYSENITYTTAPETAEFFYPRSGVWADSSRQTGGSWESAYDNMRLPASKMQQPKHLIAQWEIECLQSKTDGPGGHEIYPNVPASNANFSLYRWALITSQLADCYHDTSGVQILGAPTSAGKKRNTVLFDESGLINGRDNYGFGSGVTKLYYKWMGAAIDTPNKVVQADGSVRREFEHALIILNPDNDIANGPITIDVSLLPGGASEWMRFNGVQDSTTNNGSYANVDFPMNPVDGIILVRRSWYEAL